MKELSQEYPDITHLYSIGKSVEGNCSELSISRKQLCHISWLAQFLLMANCQSLSCPVIFHFRTWRCRFEVSALVFIVLQVVTYGSLPSVTIPLSTKLVNLSSSTSAICTGTRSSAANSCSSSPAFCAKTTASPPLLEPNRKREKRMSFTGLFSTPGEI